MSAQSVYFGPRADALADTAFEAAAEAASMLPESVLLLESNRRRRGALADRWAERYPTMALTTTSLPSVIERWLEAIEGPSRRISTDIRRRLVEDALQELDEALPIENPQSLVLPLTELFTELEQAGYLDAEGLQHALDASPVDGTTASIITDTFSAFQNRLAATLTPGVYSQSRATQHVATDPSAFSVAYETVDVVILSGYYDLSPLETQAIAALTNTVPLIGMLPSTATSVDELSASAPIGEAVETYTDLGFSPAPVTDGPRTAPRRAAEAMYSYQPTSVAAEGLQWRECPTPEAEVRTVARELRATLDDGTSPDSIAVVVPGLLSYREYITDLFDRHGIPYALQANKTLDQTFAGSLIDALLSLGGSNPRAEALLGIVTNPLVEPVVEGYRIDPPTVREMADRTHDRQVATVVDHLPDTATAGVNRLRASCESLEQQESAAAVATVRALFAELGVRERIETLREAGPASYDEAMEVRAFEAVETLLQSVEETAEQASGAQTGLARLTTALQSQMVSPPPQSDAGRVAVLGLLDSYGRQFEETYLVGALESHLPGESELPAFFERIYDGMSGLSRMADRDQARYLVELLLANSMRVTVTTAAHDVDGEPLLTSEILTELARVADLTPSTGGDQRISTVEDAQIALGGASDPATAALTTADVGTIPSALADRISRGATCASNRATAESTPHDAQVEPSQLDGVEALMNPEPLSPSRIETYAQCGFKYLGAHGLGLSEPEPISPIPHQGTVGTYIHEVLRAFYESFDDPPTEPADLHTLSRDAAASRLLQAGRHVLDTADDPGIQAMEWQTETAFVRQQFEELFAGLGTPAENRYFAPQYPHAAPDRGLFARFLDEEFDALSEDAGPIHLEYPFGGLDADDEGDERRIELETPGGPVAVRGQVDRVDLDRSGDDAKINVFDYKTGSVPSTKETTTGHRFQLPIYLAAVTDSVSIDAVANDSQYYHVQPPGTVTRKKGLRASVDSLTGFLQGELPARLERVVNGLEAGSFQPTFLDADDANCEYCAFRDACDIRHHQRHKRVEAVADDPTVYVPPSMLDGEPFSYAPTAADMEDESQ